jgi:hypothetical protein
VPAQPQSSNDGNKQQTKIFNLIGISTFALCSFGANKVNNGLRRWRGLVKANIQNFFANFIGIDYFQDCNELIGGNSDTMWQIFTRANESSRAAVSLNLHFF